MKRIVNRGNPFGCNRYGFLWEVLFELKGNQHLDYGCYNGKVLNELFKSNAIKDGVGVDLNRNIVEEAQSSLTSEYVNLIYIDKKDKLEFESNSFDSISILDVIEHIYDQDSVLKELFRVLKPNGILVITVPKKHILSFLDLGNYKFIFPKLHKYFVVRKYGFNYYNKRYVECENGLFGDIEKEKMWHQHFNESEMSDLLTRNGFEVSEMDGSGLFDRLLNLISLVFGNKLGIISNLKKFDAKNFSSANLYCVARKSE